MKPFGFQEKHLALAALLAAACMPHAWAAPSRKTAPRKPAVKPAATAAIPADVTRLEILPGGFSLDGARAAQRLVVVGATKDGATRDLTDRVTFTLSNPKVARIAGGTASPVADGETRIVARMGSLSSAPVAVTVTNSKTAASTEFVNDVMPILAKTGCNSTACHGSPAGKGGLKLSLFGYEPELDHPALVKDQSGKRVNLKNPEQSLLLQKASMQVPHAGGQRFKQDSREYRTFLAWLKEGAPGIGEFEARVRSVQVLPDEAWMPAPGSHQRLTVRAEMSDGTARDVTEKVLFSSNDDAIADVDADGRVSGKRAGETAVMVRYLGRVAVSRVAVLPAWKLPEYPKVAGHGFIDELVQAKLKKLRMVPSAPCTDEEFIRRATLDVCGIIPTPEEVTAFVADTVPDKRAKLIDRLLERPEFVDLWTLKWNDILRNNPRVTRVGMGSYAKWIREQIATNRPYNEFVHDLITASGKSADITLDMANLPPQLARRPNAEALIRQLNAVAPNPAANYYVVSKDPLDVTSATSQIFLGVRIECARCHNHPFEKWTQNDYYGLAAFFNGVTARGGNQAPNIVMMNPRSPGLRHPKTNEIVEPRTLDNAEVKLERGADKRGVVADWITSSENPYFARALVNRLWAHYFGKGIIDPIDDVRVTNPASNPDLLEALGKEFVARKFDVKAIHRLILNSATYQQSSRTNQYNAQDTRNFARFYPKRLMAEQLYDSISQATGIFLQMPGGRGGRRPLAAQGGLGGLLQKAYQGSLPDEPVTRVMQIPALVAGQGGARPGAGNLVQFLDTFGKPRREAVCECERSSDGNMGQALALLNGDEVNDKIAAPRGRVQQLIRSGKPDAQIVEELYLAALSRRPTQKEQDEAATLIRSSKSHGEGIEDLMWSLLNSREFLFIH